MQKRKPQSRPASALCALCGHAGEVETNTANALGVATALLWALHFARQHPDAARPISQHVIVAPITR